MTIFVRKTRELSCLFNFAEMRRLWRAGQLVIINCNRYENLICMGIWGSLKIHFNRDSVDLDGAKPYAPYGIHCQEFTVKMLRRWCSMLASLVALLTSPPLSLRSSLCALSGATTRVTQLTYARDPRITSSSGMHASPFCPSPPLWSSPTKDQAGIRNTVESDSRQYSAYSSSQLKFDHKGYLSVVVI